MLCGVTAKLKFSRIDWAFKQAERLGDLEL